MYTLFGCARRKLKFNTRKTGDKNKVDKAGRRSRRLLHETGSVEGPSQTS